MKWVYFILFLPCLSFAAIHTVAASGGTFSTIAQVNAHTFAPGDSILFKRGETWTGTELVIGQSGTAGNPIFIGAYGSGAKPIITQRVAVPGWSTSGNWVNTSGHLWRFNIGTRCPRLWDGVKEFVQTYDTSASTGPQGNTTRGLTQNYQYNLEHSGSSLTGYIRVYCLNDQPWSFYANPIYLGPGTWDYLGYCCIGLQDVNFITIQNITFGGANYVELDLYRCDNIVVDSCDFLYGHYGIYTQYGSHRGEVKNCTFNALDTVQHDYEAPATQGVSAYNADQIQLYQGANNWLIHNNTFIGANHTAISMRGYAADSTHQCNYNQFYENTISGGGADYCRAYEALAPSSNAGGCAYNRFFRNYVHGMTEQIQLQGDHNSFTYNIIDTVKRSWKPNGYQAAGINMGSFEDVSYDTVANNTIMNTASAGLYIVNNADDMTTTGNVIINNIFFNCGTDLGTKQGMKYAGLVIDSSDVGKPGAMVVKNNLCYSPYSDSAFIYHAYYWSTTAVNRKTGTQFNLADVGTDVLSGNTGGDPLVGGDHKIASGSPAKNAGTLLGYVLDYFGSVVPNGTTDIGAHEYYAPSTGRKLLYRSNP